MVCAELAHEEGRAPVERRTRGRARDVADQARRHLGVEHDGHLRGLHPPRPEPAKRPLRRDAPDLLRDVEPRALARHVVPAVPLHLVALRCHRRRRERERRGLVLAPEPVARRVGVAGAAVGEVASLRVLDPRVGREGRRLRAARQLDLGLGLEVVARRVGEIELRQVAGQEIGVRQPGQLIRARDARQRHGLLHQPGDRVPGEVGGGRGGHRLADEDAQGQVLLARVLDRIHLAEAHLGGERLVADHEGVAGRRAAAPGLIEHVGEEVEHR